MHLKTSNLKLFGAYACLVLAQTMVGINIVGAKYLLASTPIFLILLIRFSLASIMLFALYAIFQQRKNKLLLSLTSLTKKDWIYISLQALTAGILFNVLMIIGLSYTDANIAGIITSALPAMIAVMSFIFLKEPVTAGKLFAILFATLGLFVISAHNMIGAAAVSNSLLGDLIILIALIPEATYYVLSKFYVNKLPIFLVSAIMHAINAVLLIPLIFFQVNFHLLHFSWLAGLVLIIISISSGLFFVFWYLGSDHVDSTMASLLTAIMPIATIVIAWLALGEVINLTQLIGMGLVISSIVVYTMV